MRYRAFFLIVFDHERTNLKTILPCFSPSFSFRKTTRAQWWPCIGVFFLPDCDRHCWFYSRRVCPPNNTASSSRTIELSLPDHSPFVSYLPLPPILFVVNRSGLIDLQFPCPLSTLFVSSPVVARVPRRGHVSPSLSCLFSCRNNTIDFVS